MQETVRDAKCDVYHTMAVLCGASHSRASVAGTLLLLIVWSVTQVAQLWRAPLYRVCCDIEHITDCPWRMSQGMRECDVYHMKVLIWHVLHCVLYRLHVTYEVKRGTYHIVRTVVVYVTYRYVCDIGHIMEKVWSRTHIRESVTYVT